jgi:hypothetical protein
MNTPNLLSVPPLVEKKKRAPRKPTRRKPRERELQCARASRVPWEGWKERARKKNLHGGVLSVTKNLRHGALSGMRDLHRGVLSGMRNLRQEVLSNLRSAWRYVILAIRPFHVRCAARRLRTVETLSLGNRRTISLVQVDGQDFLVGATGDALSLLACLERPREKMARLAPLATKTEHAGDSGLEPKAQFIVDFDSRVQ